MKKWIIWLLAALLIVLLTPASADTDIEVQVDLTYRYDMTECMLDLVNDFRTGGNAWLWDKNNENKVAVTGLSALNYDYGLEKVAMQRAAECAIFFSHTRPDGSDCFSIYPGGHALGENIAAGYGTTESVFTGWKEENDDYSGQGHRRNMLSSSFTHIGIGCVYADGTYFWCQAFSGGSTGEAKSALKGPATVSTTVEMLSTTIGISNLSASQDSLKIQEGASASLPTLSGNSCGWGGARITLPVPPWTVSDTTVASIDGKGKITALKGGKTTLTVNLGSTLSIDFTAICNSHSWDEGTVTKKPTCTAKGTRTCTCKVCSETKTESIAKAAHTLVAHKRVEPTCIKEGNEAYWSCSACGGLFSDAKGKTAISKPVPIAKVDHSWDDGTVTKKPTCTAKGILTIKCKVCDKTKTESIAKAAHTLVAHKRVEPTCAEEGHEAYWSCSACGGLFSDAKGKTAITKPVPIAKVDHSWDDGTVTKEPTCTAKGILTIRCKVCDKTKTESIDKLPHTIVANRKVEPTCTEDGHEAYWSCSACGEMFSDAKGKNTIAKPVTIARLGHDWGEAFYTWADDYSKVTAKRVCERDAKHTETETVTATYKVTQEATTKLTGTGTYTSKTFRNKAFKVQTATVEIPKYPSTYADKNCEYIIKDNLTAVVRGPAKASLKKITIPAAIKVNGKSMKVVGIADKAFKGMKKLTTVVIGKNIRDIGKNAFNNCKKLKKITIKSTLLTKNSVKKNAFKGINAKAAVKCPKKKLKAYKQFLYSRGVPKTAKIQ